MNSTAERTAPVAQAGQGMQQPFIESDPKTWSETDYQRLLAEFDSLFNTPPGAPQEARYDALADLIEAYEYATEPWVREELAIVEAEKARRHLEQPGQTERKLVTL